MKIIFMGTPDIAVKVLESLVKSENEVLAAVTQPDKAKGRGEKLQYTPVKEFAISQGIPVLQPEKVRDNDEFFEALRGYNPDVIVVAAYGQIIPKNILDLPKYGCINVHASLLPKLRGAAPIQQAIIDGEKETGITIMQMEQGLDTGDMLLKGSVEIGDMNFSELHDCLAELGGKLIVEALEKLEKGELTPEKQDDSLSSYAHMISKADGEIDFEKSAEAIERLIRGFDPWPGAYGTLEINGKPAVIKLWKAEVLTENGIKLLVPEYDADSALSGEILSVDNKGIIVNCGDGALLVTEIQVPGKKRVAVKDFLLGNRLEKGAVIQGRAKDTAKQDTAS